MLPVTLPEPLPLLQAASMDSVMEALASLPAELREQKDRHINFCEVAGVCCCSRTATCASPFP